MLGKNPYYHQTMRNCIIGFGKMFSDLEFERKDNTGAVQQKILVPIAYGPKEKWVQRLEQDPDLENQTKESDQDGEEIEIEDKSNTDFRKNIRKNL